LLPLIALLELRLLVDAAMAVPLWAMLFAWIVVFLVCINWRAHAAGAAVRLTPTWRFPLLLTLLAQYGSDGQGMAAVNCSNVRRINQLLAATAA
jgi:hypothetical protein